MPIPNVKELINTYKIIEHVIKQKMTERGAKILEENMCWYEAYLNKEIDLPAQKKDDLRIVSLLYEQYKKLKQELYSKSPPPPPPPPPTPPAPPEPPAPPIQRVTPIQQITPVQRVTPIQQVTPKIFKNDSYNNETTIPYLRRYYSVRNRQFNSSQWPQLLLDLKNGEVPALFEYYNLINNVMNNDNKFYICSPPSSQPGIGIFITILGSQSNNRFIPVDIFSSNHALRVRERRRRGEMPTLEEVKDNLNINVTAIREKIPILIIDDVITTGTTLMACLLELKDTLPSYLIRAMALTSAHGEGEVSCDPDYKIKQFPY